MSPHIRRWALFALLAGAAACASAPVGSEREVAVTITNDLNLGPATVFIRSFGSLEHTLGVVPAFETRTLYFTGSSAARDFQLRALVAGRDVVSKEFDLPTGADVAWAMRSNFVRPIQSDGSR